MTRYVRIQRRFVNLRPRPERAFEGRFRVELLVLTALRRAVALLAAFAVLVRLAAFLAVFFLAAALRTPPLDTFFAFLAVPRPGAVRAAGLRPAARRPATLLVRRLLVAAAFRRGLAARSWPMASVTSSIGAM